MGNSFSEGFKWFLDQIFGAPPPQPCQFQVDQSILDQAKKEMEEKEKEIDHRMKELELEKARVEMEAKEQEIDHRMRELELEKAKADAEIQLEKMKIESRKESRYKGKDQAELEFLRQQAYEKLGLDSVEKINICVTGKSGVGKSTLINGLLELEADDPGAAKVDVNECTSIMTGYPHPTADHIVLWDCPGADTFNHPRETYFFDNYLYAFDYLLIVFTERFSESETDLIKQSIAHQVPFAVVRNKTNVDFLAKQRMDKKSRESTPQEIISWLIKEHHLNTILNLQQAGIDSDKVKMFVINAFSFVTQGGEEVVFEEPKLVKHILRMIGKRRGYGFEASNVVAAAASAVKAVFDLAIK